MVYLYNLILYKPLLNALIFFYNTVAFQDLGLAIIFLTLLIRIVLFPLFHKSAHHQVVMQKLQPHIKKIQDDHKKDKEKQAQAMMALYKEHRINPFSGFFLLLVQLPILIALYRIFLNTLRPDFLSGLYTFVVAPEIFQSSLLGLINLGERSILMVSLAALAQYFQAKLAIPKVADGKEPTQAEKMGRQMVFIGPIITIAIFYSLPAAVGLYWATSSLFSIFQQIIVNRQIADGKPGTTGQKNN